MEFDLGADGTLTPLPKPVHRHRPRASSATAAMQQGVISVYETDGYQAIMDWIEAESGVALRRAPRRRRRRTGSSPTTGAG